ncbi:glycosyltransferase family 2 protein [Haloflavibacter putidus]|uniref:Glycosyltransferase family 2 protein n=1 Tax=Haloflavibacter putidus TaxID=2576776 RepID=A0A507Z8Z2_9FLAO|nr:glycosyltransferase family 2 protein [Haloflavibacter putidus]TQD33497.1 glycosyltransferase family 2 protein [Haloflavibacter putidus]
MKAFSIIIPTLNRTEYLLNTLQDLVGQKYSPGFEILVIDQSEKPDKAVQAFAEKNTVVKYHFITEFRGLPEARNYGAQLAKHPYLLYLDDDISCKENLLQEHANILEKEAVGVCAGGITEVYKPNKEQPVGKFIWQAATPLRGFHKKDKKEVDHAGGGNFAVKRKVYLEVKGIDEQLTKGAALYEETDFCLRVKKAGYQIYFNCNAHVMHLAAETGGCRVPEIEKYIFSLSRNRSLLIERHLPWYFKITAHLYLLKLVAAYYKAYRNPHIWKNYKTGKTEGKALGKLDLKNEQTK